MSTIWAWLAKSPIASFVKVFVAVVLGAAVADWASSGSIDFANAQTWIIAALVSALPPVINWLNPVYPLYGRGKAVSDE